MSNTKVIYADKVGLLMFLPPTINLDIDMRDIR